MTAIALVDAGTYVAAVVVAFHILRRWRVKWIVPSAALYPAALFQVSTITADTLTNALALLFFALVTKSLAFGMRLGKAESALALSAVMLLPLSKPTYILLAALFPALRLAAQSRRSEILLKSLVSSLALILWGVWTYISADTSKYLAFYRSDYTTSEFGLWPQITDTLERPLHAIANAFRTFLYRENFYFLDLIGSSNVRVPSTSVVLGILALAIAVLATETSVFSRRLLKWQIGLVLIVSVLAIFGTLYGSFTPVGYYLFDGVQGRYFFPLLSYFALWLSAVIPMRAASIRRSGPMRKKFGDEASFISDVNAIPLPEKYVGAAVLSLLSVALGLTALKYWGVVWGIG